MTELTLEELADLENVSNWTAELRVEGERASRLLAMARELIRLKSALYYIAATDTALIGRPFAPASIIALAAKLGWLDPVAELKGGEG